MYPCHLFVILNEAYKVSYEVNGHLKRGLQSVLWSKWNS
jgi:hypothetical protein